MQSLPKGEEEEEEEAEEADSWTSKASVGSEAVT